MLEGFESTDSEASEAFQKANHLSWELAEILPNITPISVSDLALFQQFFAQDIETYGNSWTYLNQAMNSVGPEGRGFKYFDGENLIPFVVYPDIEDSSKLNIYFIRPMGISPIRKVAEMKDLIRLNGYTNTIYVKNLSYGQYTELMASDFVDISQAPWHPEVIAEDNTFPGVIIEIPRTLKIIDSQSRTQALKTSYRDAERLKVRWDLRFSAENFIEDAANITRQFFDLESKRPGSLNLSRPRDYSNMIFNQPEGLNILKEVLYVNGHPMGFYVIEVSSNEDIAYLYALLSLSERKSDQEKTEYREGVIPKIKRLNDYIMFYLIDELDKLGITFFGLGGSETPGLHSYKMKFLPYSEVERPGNKYLDHKYWAVNLGPF